MCDTMIAMGNSTADGSVILAKNSDREPNEAQALVYIPAMSHAAGATVKCTFTEIPQVRETRAVMLSKPFWMFGCEMGVNDAGVAIGNEAVFTKEPYEKAGLSGMDLIRLALERSDSAKGAVETIVELLTRHGQCASGGYQHTLNYHNSFIVADAGEAYVLETANRYWVVEQVRDTRSISNGLTIGREWDDASPDLVDHAITRGWCKSASEFHFADCYREPFYTFFSASRPRHACTSRRLREGAGHIDTPYMAGILRDHGGRDEDVGWSPARGIFGHVCAHAGPGPIRSGSQTAGSMIAHLKPGDPTCWFTGTSAPCTSTFKPAWFNAGEQLRTDFGPEPAATFDPAVRWWRHEQLHRATLENYATRHALYRAERDALETDFFTDAQNTGDRGNYSHACFQRADAAEAEWLARVREQPVARRPGALYRRFWASMSRRAGA